MILSKVKILHNFSGSKILLYGILKSLGSLVRGFRNFVLLMLHKNYVSMILETLRYKIEPITFLTPLLKKE